MVMNVLEKNCNYLHRSSEDGGSRSRPNPLCQPTRLHGTVIRKTTISILNVLRFSCIVSLYSKQFNVHRLCNKYTLLFYIILWSDGWKEYRKPWTKQNLNEGRWEHRKRWRLGVGQYKKRFETDIYIYNLIWSKCLGGNIMRNSTVRCPISVFNWFVTSVKFDLSYLEPLCMVGVV
jgi:hypothetical protein